MSTITRRISSRPSRAIGLIVAGALGVAGCNEHFITGPRETAVTLRIRNWRDTLVVGEQRSSGVVVIDAEGAEVLDSHASWQVATPAVLASALNGATPATSGVLASVGASDSLHLTASHAGTTRVAVALADSRFTATPLAVTATVVVAGVGLRSAHDTTVTTIGDTAVVAGTAFGRSGAGLATTLTPLGGQGVVWSRQGTGAVTLIGTGDSVRAVATAAGTDTVIVSHPFCLRGARCADTTVVRVAQTAQPFGIAASTFRAWSFGDSISTSALVQDARGNAIAGAHLALVPLGSTDSAIVDVNTASNVPAVAPPSFARAATTAARNGVTTAPPSMNRVGVASARVALARPLVIVANGTPRVGASRASGLVASATRTPTPNFQANSVAPTAPLVAPPLVAKQNGTARVAVQALDASGTVLGVDTVTVIVRQVANVVQVAPAYADLTPGDSIPTRVRALDARGRLIGDATFQPSIAGALYRDGRIVVPAGAGAGTGVLQAMVTGVAAPSNNVGAPIPNPAPDTAHVVVRLPAPVAAGDTAAASANAVTTTVLGRDGQPLANTWVRFHVPAGTLQGPDSIQTDAHGTVTLRWTLPTQAGTYTATAVLLGTPASADTAGQIVLRRTIAVLASAPSQLSVVMQPPAAAALGAALTPAPVVRLIDRYGNGVRQSGVVVTASVAPNTASGFSWTGTLTSTTDTAGQAQFAGMMGAGSSGTYPIQFSATVSSNALTPAISSPVHFTVGAVQGNHSTVTISAPSIASGATATVIVTPRDASNNPIGAGQTVTVTVPGAPAAGEATATVAAVVDNGDGTYSATLTGVRAGTPLTVGATAAGVALSGPTLAVTPGAVATVHVAPLTRTATAFGAGLPFTATAADAAGNAVSTADLVWSSNTAGVATIAATGTPTAVSNGTTTITATLGGMNASATLTVQQVAASLTKQAGDGQSATISTGLATATAVRALDANGNAVVGASVQFAVAGGGGTIAGAASQTVTTGAGGIATAGSWVVGATTGANTLTATLSGVAPVTFTATAGPALALSTAVTERILRGTQQFGVAVGPAGPYTWSVAGIDGGDATVGTISTSGYYTAPASVPSPNVVQVCARVGPAATQQGCAAVTVSATPSAGGDIVVMNDNVPLSDITAYGGGLDGTHAPNEQFFRNLIGFTGSAPRASQTHVLVYQGHGAFNLTSNPMFDNAAVPGSGLDSLRTHLTQHGFTMDTSRSAVLTIPSNVKVLLLYMPTVTFSRAEINAMKQFAAEGGRMVFIGNQTNFYGPVGVAVENGLMAQLGSALVNTSAQLLQGSGAGAYATTVGTHQLTAGVSGVWFSWCSYMTLGPNDFALMTDGAAGHVVMAITKIDTTPLP